MELSGRSKLCIPIPLGKVTNLNTKDIDTSLHKILKLFQPCSITFQIKKKGRQKIMSLYH